MRSILEYPFYTSYKNTVSCISCRTNTVTYSPLYSWLIFGKLGENPVISPTYRDRIVRPSSVGRTLQTVKVKRIPVVVSTVSLAANATATYTFDKAYSVVSENPSFATATITNGVVTITGIAAGTSIITVKDVNNDVIATITVTVA